jgi:hypothetical protein
MAMQWDSIKGWVAVGMLVFAALFAWWYNSGGDQANNLTKTRNRGISGERGDAYRDQGGM